MDLGAGEPRLPDSKIGAKIIRLGDPAIEGLRDIPRPDDGSRVIMGAERDKPLHINEC